MVSDWRDTEPKDKEMMTFSHQMMTPLLACSSREESTNNKSITTQGIHSKKKQHRAEEKQTSHLACLALDY
jgi:hypothetical protein